MPKVETAGYKRFWPMRQLVGRDRDGSKRAVKGYRNMLNGEFHVPKNGWSGSPPELPIGERLPEISSNYAKNYDEIRWDKR